VTRYRTLQGDMVDAICKAHYDDEAMAQAVYDANPGLAAHGPLLPAGLVITLPVQAGQTVERPIRLWGKADA